MNKFSLRVLAIVVMCVAWAQTYKLHSAPKITPKVVTSFPHNNTSFTQGLIIIDDIFYESSGLYGKSSLRKVDKYTGKLINSINLDPNYFGEGLTIIGDNFINWPGKLEFYLYTQKTL